MSDGNEFHEILGCIVKVTEKAVQITDGLESDYRLWVPKSVMNGRPEDWEVTGEMEDIGIKMWFCEKNDIITI